MLTLAEPSTNSRWSFDPGEVVFWDNGLWRELRSIAIESGAFGEIRVGNVALNMLSESPRCYLFPGLVDGHVHLGDDPDWSGSQLPTDSMFEVVERNLKTALGVGITTLRDVGSLGGNVSRVQSWRDERRAAGAVLPRIVSAGSFITMEGFHASQGRQTPGTCVTRDSLVGTVAQLLRDGADFIKVMNDPICFSTAEMTEIVTLAGRHGRYVASHTYTEQSAEIALASGVSAIEHLGNYSADLLSRFAQNNVVVVTTAIAALDAVTVPATDAEIERSVDLNKDLLRNWYLNCCRVVKRASEYPIAFVCGSDAGCAGTSFDSIWREIFFLNTLGLNLKDCIASATSLAHAKLRLRSDGGRIATGRQADFSIFDVNPLTRRERPRMTFVGGMASQAT